MLKATPGKEKAPAPRDTTRSGEPEQIVYLKLSELHAFKSHSFGVRDDAEICSLVESIKAGGHERYSQWGEAPQNGRAEKVASRELTDKKKTFYTEYREAQRDMREAVAVKSEHRSSARPGGRAEK